MTRDRTLTVTAEFDEGKLKAHLEWCPEPLLRAQAAASPLNLRIIFSGLEIFAPRKAAGGKPDTMYVVLPAGHHDMDPHLAVLAFDAAYLVSGSKSALNAMVYWPIDDSVVSIGKAGVQLDVCPEILNLYDVAKARIPDSVLQADKPPRTAARVELYGGAMEAVATESCSLLSGSLNRLLL